MWMQKESQTNLKINYFGVCNSRMFFAKHKPIN